MDKFSPWFRGNPKPFRKGIYAVLLGISKFPGYSYWNGKRWSPFRDTPREAYQARSLSAADQNKSWRGLAKKP